MNIRDQMAMAAMQALLPLAYGRVENISALQSLSASDKEWIAALSYGMAEAMLDRRVFLDSLEESLATQRKGIGSEDGRGER